MVHLQSKQRFLFVWITIFIVLIISECQVQKPNGYIPSNKNKQGNSILGFVMGPIIFILSFVGTWYNEKRAAVNYKRLKLAQQILNQQSKPKQYNLDQIGSQPLKQQKLTHVSGPSQVIEAAKDEQCQVFPVGALAIQRKVQVRQMRSYSKRRSGEDEISYKLQWVDQNIEEVEAQSNSPAFWFIKSKEFYAPKARVRSYYLTQQQLKMLECDSEVIPNPEIINALKGNNTYNVNPNQPIVLNNYVYFPAQNGDIQSRGTLRVKFMSCLSTILSIISSVNQDKKEFEPFIIDLIDNNGQKDNVPCSNSPSCVCCSKLAQLLKPISQINFIIKGQYDYHEMMSLNIKKNINETYLLRLLFFVLMVVGICFFFSPLVELVGYIPLVGGFLKGTASIIVFIGAFLVSIPLFSATMGLAWLRYHPLIGAIFFAIALSFLIGFKILQQK